MVTKSIYYTMDTTSVGMISDGVAVSSTNTYYSSKFTGHNSDGQSLQLNWTGTPVGTFTFWTSDKTNPSLTNDADWIQDTTFTPTNPAGSASGFQDDGWEMRARWKRIKYVNASGSGVLTGYVTSISKS